MSDTKPNGQPVEKKEVPPSPMKGDNQWVMVFNVITGKGADEVKRTYKLNKKQVVFGSALSSDIRIQQNSVSNVHAVVELDAQGNAQIYDMASETGVFINDKKTVSAELKDGDEIKIGFATIAYKRQMLNEVQAQLPKPMVRSSGQQKLFLNEKEDFRPLILEDERNVIQIFDYPTSGAQALQVVMYWGDVILDVKHFAHGEAVMVGEDKKTSFLVPDLQGVFPLASYEGGAYVLSLTDEMDGVVRNGKQMLSIKDLKAQGGRVTLKNSDQAKIQLHGITLFLGYSPAPPVLRRQHILERDPFYTRIWFSSLLLTCALVALIVKMQPPTPLTVDELPQRVATIIFKPVPTPPPVLQEKPKPKPTPAPKKEEPKPTPAPVKKVEPPKPKPKPVPKELPKEVKKPVPMKTRPTTQPAKPVNLVKGEQRSGGGNQGQGARAAGTEGQAGKADAKKAPVHQTAAKGNPNSNSLQKSQVQGKGNVESFFNGIDGTISKNLAAGSAGANAAADKLRGHGGFTTEGNGGLGSLGEGTGGGGKSQDVAGLGTTGLGDGATGNGPGRIGSGGNLNGTGHGRPVIEIGNAQDTVIMGGLDRDVIDKYIHEHLAQIRHCYEAEANGAHADLHGRILVRFVIAGSGRVSQSGVESTSMQNANVERCLTQTISRIVFPEPLGGGEVEVSYPFAFTPAVAK